MATSSLSVPIQKQRVVRKGMMLLPICFFLSFFSFVVFVLSIQSDRTGIYQHIYVLPLFFSVFNIVFYRAYKNATIVNILVIGIQFVRFVITPLIILLEHYPVGLYSISEDSSVSFLSIFVMCFEFLCINLILVKNNNNGSEKHPDSPNEKKWAKMSVSTWLLVIASLALIILFPNVLGLYSSVFRVRDSFAYLALPSGVGYLASFFLETARFILLSTIINKLATETRPVRRTICFSLSLALIAANCLFTVSSVIVTFILNVCLFVEIFRCFSEKRKFLIVVPSTIGVFAMIVIASNYLENTLVYQSMTQMVQDYTNGYYNVFQAFHAYSNANVSILGRVEMFFLGDGVANISPFNIFFNERNSSDIFNNYLYGFKFNGGAVCPFVSQACFYFTPVLGPVVSSLPVLFSKKLESRWIDERGSSLLYGAPALVLAVSPFLYNYSTLIHIFSLIFLPIFLFLTIHKKFR